MTDTLDHVVIPYSRFLEWRDRRRTLDRPLPLPPPTTDADTPPAPEHPQTPIATTWRTP